MNCLGYRLDHSIPLIVREEEYFVADHRPAKSATKLILVIRSASTSVKIVLGVQFRVAQKFKNIPVPLIRARLGHDIDLCAGIVSVFGIRVIG